MTFLQGFIKLDQSISEKCVGQTFDGRKKEISKKNAMETKKGGLKKIWIPFFKLHEIL
jgi:hypothetical protein